MLVGGGTLSNTLYDPDKTSFMRSEFSSSIIVDGVSVWDSHVSLESYSNNYRVTQTGYDLDRALYYFNESTDFTDGSYQGNTLESTLRLLTLEVGQSIALEQTITVVTSSEFNSRCEIGTCYHQSAAYMPSSDFYAPFTFDNLRLVDIDAGLPAVNVPEPFTGFLLLSGFAALFVRRIKNNSLAHIFLNLAAFFAVEFKKVIRINMLKININVNMA